LVREVCVKEARIAIAARASVLRIDEARLDAAQHALLRVCQQPHPLKAPTSYLRP
jgi:hypothetical protein